MMIAWQTRVLKDARSEAHPDSQLLFELPGAQERVERYASDFLVLGNHRLQNDLEFSQVGLCQALAYDTLTGLPLTRLATLILLADISWKGLKWTGGHYPESCASTNSATFALRKTWLRSAL